MAQISTLALAQLVAVKVGLAVFTPTVSWQLRLALKVAALAGALNSLFSWYYFLSMSDTKNPDFSKDLTLVPKPYEQLSYTQRMYIDWKAVNGLIMVEPEDADKYPGKEMRKLKLSELASICDVSIHAFKDAKAAVPNFWDLVSERRKVLNGQTRLAAIHETWYLKARKGDWQHMNAWLLNFDPEYKEPRTKHEIEPGNALLDALNIARSRRQVIEGEVVNEPNTNSGS